MKEILKSALWYQERGFSVIPVKKNPDPDKDKKPYIKWKKYQTENSTARDIKKWWGKWPEAMIGVVTGKKAGITIIDPDSKKGVQCVDELLPEGLEIPTVETPGGGRHYWFEYVPGIPSRSRLTALTDTDARNDGGYCVVPPSIGSNGKAYRWLNGLEIGKVKPPPMPEILRDVILQGVAMLARSSAHIKMQSSSRTDFKPEKNATDFKRLQVTSGDFKEGERDQALFHLANCLVKGSMGDANILKYLSFFASHCDPPFPEKEVLAKIESAKKRNSRADFNISEEIRDFVVTSSGYFLTSDCFNRLQVTSRSEKKAVVQELLRLHKKGIIERHGTKNGCYRRIESDCEPENWQNACTDTVKLWLPFELNEMISIMPGSLLLFAGAQDAGKSAIQMNIAKENMHNWTVHYFSSELNAGAFKNRINKFPDVTPDQCHIKFYAHSTNFHDVIKTGKNDLNIIDYLEIYDNFYKISEYIAQIHKKLGDAICVVALQKDPKALYGRGGSFTQEKPMLSVALDYGKATISKFKGEFRGENPRGKEYYFKLLDGCRIVKGSGWHKPPPIKK